MAPMPRWSCRRWRLYPAHLVQVPAADRVGLAGREVQPGLAGVCQVPAKAGQARPAVSEAAEE